MILVAQDLIRYLGSATPLSIPLTHPDTGLAFNPTGYALTFTVKRFESDTDAQAVMQKLSTVGGNPTLANPSQVALVDADFGNVTWRVLYFDIQAYRSTPTESILTVAQGTIACVDAPAADILFVDPTAEILDLGQDFTRFWGDTSDFQIPLYDPATGLSFNPTGYTLAFKLKKFIDDLDVDALMAKTPAAATPAIVDLLNADFNVVLKPIPTWRPLDFTIIATMGLSVLTVAYGTITFLTDVTRTFPATDPNAITDNDGNPITDNAGNNLDQN